jgi:hypothetical protein
MSSPSSFLHDVAVYMELQVGMTITPWVRSNIGPADVLGSGVRDGVGFVAGVIFHLWGRKCMFFYFSPLIGSGVCVGTGVTLHPRVSLRADVVNGGFLLHPHQT